MVINGVEMSYGDQGFRFGDQKGQSPGDPGPLFDALKSAGITIEILPAKGTDTSIESAGMKITQVFDYKAGKQRISFILGRVRASIQGEAKPAANDLLGGLPDAGPTETTPVVSDTPSPSTAYGNDVPDVAPDTTTPAVDSELSLGGPPVAAPDLSLPASVPSGATALPPIVAAVNPPAAQAQLAAPEVRLVRPASAGRGLRDDDFSGLYAVLGAIAALATLAAFLLAGGRRRAAGAASVLRLPNA
jgi:hypothetical protein